MTENKRFQSEYYSVGYYTEIVDNEKELEDVPNPKKNLTIGEVVDTLNELHEENQLLKKGILDCVFDGKSLELFAEEMDLIE